MPNKYGTLAPTEPHPVTRSALDYLAGLGLEKLNTYREAFASCAIEGNRLGQICAETINRLLRQEPVSDPYLLGLAWAVKEMEEANG